MENSFVLPGSEASHAEGGSWLPANADEVIRATIIIRRPAGAGDVSQQLLSGSFPQMTREQAEAFMRVAPADLATVRSFAQSNELRVIGENAEARTIQVEGNLAQMGRAFGVKIEERIATDGKHYLSYQGPIMLPKTVTGIITAVLGLDQRPLAKRGASQ